MIKFATLFVVAAATALAVTAADDAAAGEAFQVKFELANLDGKKGEYGSFTLEVHPDWAPLGAERFQEMLDASFFKGVRFFRVIDGFMAQFGIHGNPTKATEWREKSLQDDPVKESNARGTISFATSGPNSRTTQMFINFDDNSRLDGMGFSPFGKVVDGMDIVDRIYKIGEKPNQGQIQSEGNRYLKTKFPQLTFIKDAQVVSANQEL